MKLSSEHQRGEATPEELHAWSSGPLACSLYQAHHLSPKKHPRPARLGPVRGLSTRRRPDNTRRCLIANAKTLGERGRESRASTDGVQYHSSSSILTHIYALQLHGNPASLTSHSLHAPDPGLHEEPVSSQSRANVCENADMADRKVLQGDSWISSHVAAKVFDTADGVDRYLIGGQIIQQWLHAV